VLALLAAVLLLVSLRLGCPLPRIVDAWRLPLGDVAFLVCVCEEPRLANSAGRRPSAGEELRGAGVLECPSGGLLPVRAGERLLRAESPVAAAGDEALVLALRGCRALAASRGHTEEALWLSLWASGVLSLLAVCEAAEAADLWAASLAPPEAELEAAAAAPGLTHARRLFHGASLVCAGEAACLWARMRVGEVMGVATLLPSCVARGEKELLGLATQLGPWG